MAPEDRNVGDMFQVLPQAFMSQPMEEKPRIYHRIKRIEMMEGVRGVRKMHL
jgi:hypothetical protein